MFTMITIFVIMIKKLSNFINTKEILYGFGCSLQIINFDGRE